MVKGAWVTLATNDSYSLGALVLAHSLKQVGTQQELAVLVTPGVTNSMRARLSDVFNIVREVNVLDSRDKANLKLLQRPELGITFTKLHCWQLTEYEKCVFLDADTLVLQNCDELFEREELSAAPDVGWPDCFNSGVFVYRPSDETYNSLIQFALDKGSFDGGDQGLLNLYFADWARKDISKHLPFIYNVCSTAFYSYLPAFKQFGKDVKIIHFIGNAKPWLQYFDTESKKVRPSRDLGHLEPILQRWWNIFCSMIHPNLSPDMSGLAGAFAKLTLGQQRTPEQEALEDSLRRQNWEQGNIDYLGKDSFDNIWSKICETLAKGPQESEGENTTQLKSDDLVLASPQLETCTPTKADVLSASQEPPLTTSSLPTDQETLPSDPISASTPLVISSVEAPIGSDAIEKQASPKRDPSPQEKIPSENDPSAQENISSSKIEESSESKSVSIPAEQTTSETMKPLEEIPKSVVSGVEITSEKLPLVGKTLESANILVEQKTPEDISSVKETSKPEIDPIPTEPNSEGTQPDKQASEEKVPASPVAEVSVPSPEVPKQDIPKESAVSASQTVLSSQQALPTEHEASAPPQISPEVPVCPLKEAPPVGDIIPTSTIAEASPSEQIIQHETPASPNIALSEQSLTSEKSSCTLAKTAIPTEPPKPETVALEKILQPLSEEMAASPTTQNLPVKQEPEQVSSEKTLELSSPSEKKASPPPAETALPKETPAKPEQITPEKVPQPPSQTKEQVPTVPTQTEPSKPEQVSPQKISQPSSPSDEKVSPSKIQTAPVKPEPTQQEGSQSPVTSSQPALTPASQSANVAATSPVASSEPVPPITPPPRKSGGNKKQSKSKK